MRYYPINLDLRQRQCLVVGAGAVGLRKALALLDCGAEVTVIGRTVTPRVVELAARRDLRLKNRDYRSTDLEGMFLVIGATDSPETNRRIHNDAHRRNILCNIADRPEVCNFILPSIIRRGDLIIAVSTSGKSPAFAKKVRQDLERQFGPEYAEFLDLMGAIRKKLLNAEHSPEAHKPLFEKLIGGGLLEMVRNRKAEEINLLLRKTLGPGYEVDALNLQLR